MTSEDRSRCDHNRIAPSEAEIEALLRSFQPTPSEHHHERMQMMPWARSEKQNGAFTLPRLGRLYSFSGALLVIAMVALWVIALPSIDMITDYNQIQIEQTPTSSVYETNSKSMASLTASESQARTATQPACTGINCTGVMPY